MASSDAFLDQPRQIIAATLVVAAVIAVFAAIYVFGDVLLSLFVGIVLATALKPIIDVLQRRGVRQPAAVAAVYACVTLFLGIGIALGAAPLFDRVRELAAAVPPLAEKADRWLANAGNVPWASVVRRLLDGFSFGHAAMAPEQSLATVGRTATALAIAVRELVTASMVLLLAFYWSLQGDRTIRWLLLLLPVARRDGARDTIVEMEAKLGAYIRGQGLVCLAMAVMAGVVYGLLGLHNAVILGLVAGLLEIVPVLGPILGVVPPLGVALFNDPAKAPWVLVAAIAMQQVESYLIVPRIMDKSVGVHPMVTLLALAAFGSLFGITGAILAIPLGAIVQVLLNRFVLVPAATTPEPPNGRGALGVLRYDAQKLLCDIRLRDKAEPPAGEIGQLAEAIEAIARDLDERLKKVDGPDDTEGHS